MHLCIPKFLSMHKCDFPGTDKSVPYRVWLHFILHSAFCIYKLVVVYFAFFWYNLCKEGEIMNQAAPIGVFDSGVGGISVLRELVRLMPNENYIYYGDSANAPYGSRPTGQVRALSLAVAEKLVSRGVKALVVACNTATAAAVELLRSTYPDLIIIGIEPALKLAADRFPTGNIGVMATQVTLREEKFAHQLERFPHAAVHLIPAPGLVECIEGGHLADEKINGLLEPLLAPYVGKLDALVLGCTHYPFAAQAVRKVLGDKTLLLDGGAGTARQTKNRLRSAGLLWDGPGSVILENSSDDPRLIKLCEELLKNG